jgi:predicted RND superfamily exporter protein|tara:strand:- start:2872 stop:5136 length:2265 start_codon:yes stop_codon:yes gene_type:complete
MFKKLVSNYFNSIKDRKFFYSAIILLAIFCSSLGINNFRFDASSETLILDNDVDYQIYEQTNDDFGSSDFLILAIQSSNEIFTLDNLQNLQNLRDKIQVIEGVDSVVSVFDAPILEQPKLSLIKSASNDKYLLEDELNLSLAKQELIDSPIFSELVISKDGKTLAFQINLDGKDNYDQTVIDIRSEIETFKNFNINLAGPSMIVFDTINFIKNDVITFGTITILVFFIFLYLIFRDFWPVTIILLNALIVMFISIGVMGLMDWPISIVSSNFLALLLITSIAISIHILAKVQTDVDKNISTSKSLSDIFMPCLFTALTTIVGFASLILSDIKPVIDFGKMMSVGVLLNLLSSFLFIPLALELKNIKSITQKNIADFVYNNGYVQSKGFIKKAWIPFLLIFIPLIIYLPTNLKVENKFIDYFNKETEIYKGMETIDKNLGGTTPFDIILSLPEAIEEVDEEDLFFSENSETAKYWWKKDNMDKLQKVQNEVSKIDELGKVLSIANGIELAQNLNNNQPLGDLELAFVRNSLLDSERAQKVLETFIDETEKSTKIFARTIDSSPNLNRNELINSIDKILQKNFEGTEIDYQITGLGVLYNNLLQSLFSSQIKTLSFVLVSIFLMVSFLFRSLLVGFSVMFIPSISVGVVMSSMSILNIPLDIMTITIASICVGMSVDYAIHFAWRYLKENDEKKTLLSAGRAILITGSTIIMGFLVFLFSNFNPTILFGVFSGIAIFFAMFLSIYLLPRILDLQSK